MHSGNGSGSGTDSPGIEIETRTGVAVVRPYGEMDIARAADLGHAIARAAAGPDLRDVVIDLQHLLFCDSSGLNVQLTARTTVAAAGRRLHLAAPRRQFLHLLEVTGTSRLFSTDPAPPF
ncbi:STAS domain-containing protein [Streptomyces sp. NPDC001674]|uniref:STAS domain-containing protein n=1 Tax=Streptomyces sp. NPDC001674 TaxID=3154394 RepID=UPI00331FFF38